MLSFTPDAVLVDLDETLLKSRRPWSSANRIAARRLGVTLTERQKSQLLSIPFREILEQGDAPKNIVDDVIAVRDALLERLLKKVAWNDGAPELLHFLQPHFYTAIVTNGHRKAVDIMDSVLGFGNMVDDIVDRDQVERPKPFADPILLASSKLGVQVECTVMVGDSVVDIDAAKAAGSTGILLRADHNRDLVPQRVVHSLQELQSHLRRSLRLQ